MAHLTPTSQQHKVFPVLFRALNGKYQLFIPSSPPTEIELRAQEKCKITSQCRAWIPVWISRGLKSHPVLKNSPRFPWSPQHGPSISSYQALEDRPATQPNPVTKEDIRPRPYIIYLSRVSLFQCFVLAWCHSVLTSSIMGLYQK